MNISATLLLSYQGMEPIFEKLQKTATYGTLVTITLVFLGLSMVSYGVMNLSRTSRLLWKYPTVPRVPFLGSVPFLLGSYPNLAERMALAIDKLGRRFVFWTGHTPYLVISDADGAQKVLSSSKFIEKGKDYKQFHWLMGNGLITSNGQVWKEDRKQLSPTFKYQKFDGFLHCFNKHSKILVEILDQTCAGKGANLHPLLCRATMDFISESALGQPSSYQSEIHSKFFEAVGMALDSFRTRVVKPWLTLPIIWDIFGHGRQDRICMDVFFGILREAIDERKRLIAATPLDDVSTSETKPFVDSLLETRSYEEITGHILTIFGAGFETTASGMNYTLFLLALNPVCLAKVHEELDRIFAGREEDDTEVTFSDLAELKYLEMCIKESLRLFPPAPVIIRHATEDIALDRGQVIPKGVDAVFLIREIQRDPETWPDPKTFDPDRFLSEACATRHPYSFIPFSAGPRNCLGMKYAMVQMKACLAHILRHFRVTTKQQRKDLKLVIGMVLEPHPAINLTLSRRRTITKSSS